MEQLTWKDEAGSTLERVSFRESAIYVFGVVHGFLRCGLVYLDCLSFYVYWRCLFVGSHPRLIHAESCLIDPRRSQADLPVDPLLILASPKPFPK